MLTMFGIGLAVGFLAGFGSAAVANRHGLLPATHGATVAAGTIAAVAFLVGWFVT